MAKKIAAETKQMAGKQPPAEERGPTIEDRFAEFSARYKWYFIVPLVLVIALMIALVIGSGRARIHRKAAMTALRTAKTAADYETVAAEYPATFSGRLALVRAGDQLFRDGKYADARAKYEAFLASRPDPLLGIPVRTGVIQTYIRQKDYTAAIEACDGLLEADGRQFAEHQAMYYKAYCYEQLGQLKDAETWYKKVAPLPTSRADYAVMQRSWWARGWQRLDEVQRRLKQKPEDTLAPVIRDVPSPVISTPNVQTSSS
jgi:tetratricopeptide (TPR) repeat protein